jgi:hypothetical protein
MFLLFGFLVGSLFVLFIFGFLGQFAPEFFMVTFLREGLQDRKERGSKMHEKPNRFSLTCPLL